MLCVDTWLGGSELQYHDHFETFITNVTMMGLLSNVTPARGDSKVILPTLVSEKRKYSLILIDGDHGYKTVKSDLENAWTMLSDGGVLVVDDYFGYDDVQRACDELGEFVPVQDYKMVVKIKERPIG